MRKLDVAGELPPLEIEAGEATTLALVPEPVEQGDGPELIKLAGDGQRVLAGAEFELVVGANLSGGVPLVVSATPNLAACSQPPLGVSTPIRCTMSASLPGLTQVQITVSVPALDASVTFAVAAVPPGLPDALTITSGNNQNIPGGSSFSLSVRSIRAGLPFSGGTISVTAIQPAAATCPGSRTASLLGEATFECSSDAVATLTPITVELSDGLNTATFNLNLFGTGGPSDGLRKVSPDPADVLEGTTITLTVEAKSGDSPQVGLQLNVAVAGTALTCPPTATTSLSGQAAIACQANQVAQNTTTTVTVSQGARSVTFTVTVINQSQSDGLQIVSGNAQVVTQNTQFPQPLVVSARVNGVPQSGLRLTIQTNSAAVFCSDQVLTDSDGVGVIVCNAGSVAGFTTVQILVTDETGRILPEPFSATVSPTPVGLATKLELLTDGPLIGTVGELATTPLRVRALNESGAPVPGATVFFRSSADLSFSPSVATTNLTGEAVAGVTFGCPPRIGTIQIGLTATSTQATLDYQANNGPLAQRQILQGNNQSGSPGVRMAQALVVRTADVCGNAVPSTAVAWGVNPPEAAALEVVGQVSNSQGQASALVRPTARGGPFQVLVAAQADSSIQATFQLTVTNIPTFFRRVSGDGQNVPANAVIAEPLVVEVLNEQNQPVAGVNVSFSVISAGGAIESQSGATNAQGRSSALVRAGAPLGPLTVRATALGQTVDFTLTVLGAKPAQRRRLRQRRQLPARAEPRLGGVDLRGEHHRRRAGRRRDAVRPRRRLPHDLSGRARAGQRRAGADPGAGQRRRRRAGEHTGSFRDERQLRHGHGGEQRLRVDHHRRSGLQSPTRSLRARHVRRGAARRLLAGDAQQPGAAGSGDPALPDRHGAAEPARADQRRRTGPAGVHGQRADGDHRRRRAELAGLVLCAPVDLGVSDQLHRRSQAQPGNRALQVELSGVGSKIVLLPVGPAM